MSLESKKILLAVTGGIAAYKAILLARLLKEAGAEIQVVMTHSAKEFIQPLTFQALTGHPVRESLFDIQAEAGMGHIELARWPDAIMIAPASANTIAKLSHGLADDLLSTLFLATTAPVFIVPAMNQIMWQHPATQLNINVLKKLQVNIIEPESGYQACGDYGPGRMAAPEHIFEILKNYFSCKEKLKNFSILITAGPTREALDPVRYISNPSSGKMGYAIAQAAQQLGAKVTLVSGPTSLQPPSGIQFLKVNSAVEMLESVQNNVIGCDIFVSAAAVSDYRPECVASEKIPKTNSLQVKLIKNPDIVAQISQSTLRPPFVIGFAAQTHNVIELAKAKRIEKKLDAIIANQVGTSKTGFDHDTNACTIILPNQQYELALDSKKELAFKIWDTLISTSEFKTLFKNKM